MMDSWSHNSMSESDMALVWQIPSDWELIELWSIMQTKFKKKFGSWFAEMRHLQPSLITATTLPNSPMTCWVQVHGARPLPMTIGHVLWAFLLFLLLASEACT